MDKAGPNDSRRLKIVHFADAHIDIANYGRHDPATALPVRVTDFLSSLDQIIDRALSEPADLVLFAGDAYKDRNPQPTFQRAWGERMMRLSRAGIPTLLLVGNHDVAPAAGRAHTVQEFKTLNVPFISVADSIDLWGPDRLGVPLQVLTIPWIARSALMSREEAASKSLDEILSLMESRVVDAIHQLLDQSDPRLPLILTAHASVQGARYGSERTVMLGHELVLSGQVVNDRRFDYVALGHIHRHQSLNPDGHTPVVYPGSIERIDFGEAREKKGFVLAEVGRGHCRWQFIQLNTRRFVDLKIEPEMADTFMDEIMAHLPPADSLEDAICRLQLVYPRDWEPLLDEPAILAHFKSALSFHIQKHRHSPDRARLGDVASVESLSPAELLGQYWRTIGLGQEEVEEMDRLAAKILIDHPDESV